MTLTCEDLVELLFDFHGGGLPDDQLAAVKAHLCGCPPCGLKVENYSVTVRVVRYLPKAVPLPAGFEDRFRAALAALPADES